MAHPPPATHAMNPPLRIDSEAIARRISPSARHSSSGWWPLPGICHDMRDRPHLGVRDNSGRGGSDVVSVKCWVGCDRDSIRRAIESATGWRIWGLRTPDSPAPPRTGPESTDTGPVPDRREYAWKLWGASLRTDPDPDHPVRRWVARRSLYWPAPVPLPSAVRWLPAGVELVHIDAEGAPALDKPAAADGLSKRSYGVRQGAVCILGDPRPENAVGLILVEGLADALALASRYPETVATVGGISGMQADRLIDWLAAWPSVTLYADDDPDGIDGARRLRRLLAHRGLNITVYTLGGGHNDPGEFAADNPLADVDLDAAREFAGDLTDEGLPRWEAARLAMMTVGPLPDSPGSNVMSTTSSS